MPGRRNLHSGLNLIPLHVLDRPISDPTHELHISDVEYIGSYNWVEGNVPRIIVPGGFALTETQCTMRVAENVPVTIH